MSGDAMKMWLNLRLTAAGAGTFLLSSFLVSQQAPPQTGTASIGGRVTFGKDPAVGVVVAAQRTLQQGESIVLEPTSVQAVTDSDGSYLLSGLKPGSYKVRPFAAGSVNAADVPLFSMEKTRPEKTVHLEEGDRITGIDFSLSSGGVISGRIVDTDGWPIVAKRMRLFPENVPRQIPRQYSSPVLTNDGTDDRGMYRLFGVPPGRYCVGVGEISADGRRGSATPMDFPMPVTYYPGVADLSQATLVEVAEGRETANIDFKVSRFLQGYRISGFMREADSNQPVPNLAFLIYQVDENARPRGRSGFGKAGGNGEFELGGLSPGKYELTLGPSLDASYSADPVPFEIVDQDLKDLILQLRRGDAAISGQVILEGTDPAEVSAKLRALELRALILQNHAGSERRTPLAADGTFSLQGLPPGRIEFSLSSNDFSLGHYEFNGPPGNYLLEGFPLQVGERLAGLKLFFVEGKGTLIGVIHTKAGPLPANMECYIQPETETLTGFILGTETDARGMFRLEGLPPGELLLHIYPSLAEASGGPSKGPRFQEIQQRVTIRPRQETRVEAVIELVPEKKEKPAGADNP